MNNQNQFFVYLLQSSAGQTYIGATVDLDRRLRQHNKEIKGGAYATGTQVAKGEVWQRACHVSGFPSWQAALQFEWRWKQLSRADKSVVPMERRMNALKKTAFARSSNFKSNFICGMASTAASSL